MSTLTSISTPFITTTDNSSTFDATVSVAVGANQNFLVVRLVGTSIVDPASITYGGQALTEVIVDTDTNGRCVGIYALPNPPEGTADLVVDSASVTRSYQLIIDTVSNSTGYTEASAWGGWTSSFTPSYATVVGDLVLDVISTIETATVGADQTDQILNTNGASASSEVAATTSTAMSWSMAAANYAARAGVVFTAGAAVPNPVLTDTVEQDGSPKINQTNVSISVFDNVHTGTRLYSTATGTTDSNGDFLIDDDLVGNVGDERDVVFDFADGTEAKKRMTVTNGA